MKHYGNGFLAFALTFPLVRAVDVVGGQEERELQPRIVGGEPADQGAYPFYAVPIGRGLCGVRSFCNY